MRLSALLLYVRVIRITALKYQCVCIHTCNHVVCAFFEHFGEFVCGIFENLCADRHNRITLTI